MKTLTSILMFAAVQIATGRIGETPEECTKRYGEPVRVMANSGTMIYAKSGFIISVSFSEGRSNHLVFTKGRPEDNESPPMTAAEMASLLATVAGNGNWAVVPSSSGDRRWKNVAEKRSAVYVEEENTLTVLTGDEATDDLTKSTAPAAPAPGDVRLDAQTSSTSRTTDRKWETSWGSYDRTVYRSRFVTVSATARTSGSAVIECHWIGSDPGRPAIKEVTKIDRTPVEMKAGEPVNLDFGALFVQDETKYAALGITDDGGVKYYGWVVRVVTEGGAVLAAKGARPPMIALIKE